MVKSLDFGEAEVARNTDVNNAMQGVVDAFQKYRKEQPQSSLSWAVEINAEVFEYKQQLISVRFGAYEYLGGAHPNTWVRYLNFDRQTGKLLDANDLIKDRKGLTAIAEKAFRKQHKLSPDESFTKAGFDFYFLHSDDTKNYDETLANKFALSEVMAIENDKLIILYNPYDVAPYAVGSTVLIFPLDEVSQFLGLSND